MIRLGVNIDHVATLRQARLGHEPDPVAAAILALLGGANGITIHLREDRRHIQDRDVHLLRQVVTHRLNLELSVADPIVDIACAVKPDEATLVPERRQRTDHRRRPRRYRASGGRCQGHGKLHRDKIEVSLFIDPDTRQIEMAKLLGAKAVEIQTARFSEARQAWSATASWRCFGRPRFRPPARLANSLGSRPKLRKRPLCHCHSGSGGAKHRP